MVIDGHIHIVDEQENKALFLERIKLAGVGGGIVLSLHPNCFRKGSNPGNSGNARQRLDGLFLRTECNPDLYPFFWIDPLEDDAPEQVDIACNYGVLGFKVICDRYYPYDDRPMSLFRKIAAAGKPILFHSGILWDGKFSSVYNRPAGFEALIDIDGLKFALAHASWPWIDECIALYGKFQHAKTAKGSSTTSEMFIDITPGTPEIYRRELLTKLFAVGYDLEDNIQFGADCSFDDYNDTFAKKWIEMDRVIFQDLKISKETVEKVFGGNVRRFVGRRL